MLALITAGILLLARLLRLGFVADFLSRSVLIGFLTGVGIQVAMGQVAGMLGVSDGTGGTIRKFFTALGNIPDASGWTVLTSACVIAVIVGCRMINKKIPGALFAVVGSIIVSWAADLSAHGVSDLGKVPGGLPEVSWPSVPFGDVPAARRHRRLAVHRHPRAERGDLTRLRRPLRGARRREHGHDRPRGGEHRRRPHGCVRRQRQPDEDRDRRQCRRPHAGRHA